MEWLKDEFIVSTNGKGLYPIQDRINSFIQSNSVQDGMVLIQCMHTSASLVITENADPLAQKDIISFIERLIPENQSWHTHTFEGPDDSPAHMKSLITQTSFTLSIDHRLLNLGIWQGIYLFEHRNMKHQRKILLRMLKAQ